MVVSLPSNSYACDDSNVIFFYYPALVLFEQASCIDWIIFLLFTVTDQNIACSTCYQLRFGNPVVNPVHFLLKYEIWKGAINTGTCFIQKIYASLLFLTSRYISALFPFPTSSQHFSLICDPFADPIISLHSRDISLFDCHIKIYLPDPPQTNWTRIFSERRLVYFSVIETDTPLPVRSKLT